MVTHGKLVLEHRVEDETRCVVLDVCQNTPEDVVARTLTVEVWDETDEDSDEPLFEEVYDATLGSLETDLLGQGVSQKMVTETSRSVLILFDHLGRLQAELRTSE